MLVDVVLLPCVAVNVRVCDFAVSKSVAVAEVEIAPVLELTAVSYTHLRAHET